MKQSQSGFSLVLVLILLVAVIGIGLVGWRVAGGKKALPINTAQNNKKDTLITWSFNGQTWQASGETPGCSDPLTIQSPTDIKKATSVLYPGQNRGGNYKPHGGLRFDGLENNAVTVTAPADMQLVEGARYIEQGETQYLLEFHTECGIAYRFDHLLTLSDTLQKQVDTLPAAKPDDSRTTKFTSPFSVKAGETLATAVGFKNNQNVGFDFGVYDFRTPNLASKNAAFAEARQNDKAQSFYAICWVNLLKNGDAQIALSLPGGDQLAGKTSDYC